MAQPATDPAHRHGGPDAGWYRPTTQGWLPVTDTEAANERYEDMRHFMTDPRETHRRRVAAALAAWRPGQLCARCGQPITSLTVTDDGSPRPTAP